MSQEERDHQHQEAGAEWWRRRLDRAVETTLSTLSPTSDIRQDPQTLYSAALLLGIASVERILGKSKSNDQLEAPESYASLAATAVSQLSTPLSLSDIISKHMPWIIKHQIKPSFLSQNEQRGLELDDPAWKTNGSIFAFYWLAMELTTSQQFHPILHLCYPPVISLLEDHEPVFQWMGLKLLEHIFIQSSSPTDVRRMGLAPVVFDALMSICRVQEQEAQFVLGTRLVVEWIDVMEIKSTEAWAKLLLKIVDEIILQGVAYSIHDRDYALVSLLSMIPPVVRRLDMGIVLTLEPLFGSVCEILASHSIVQVKQACVNGLMAISRAASPRMARFSGLLLSSLAEAWILSGFEEGENRNMLPADSELRLSMKSLLSSTHKTAVNDPSWINNLQLIEELAPNLVETVVSLEPREHMTGCLSEIFILGIREKMKFLQTQNSQEDTGRKYHQFHHTTMSYFNNSLSASKKGENYELRAELNSEYRANRKEAVKKVIANMTVGKDVSSLFADVVKNMQTEDLELKKLVYLYLINYAKSQPELVILAVNTFVKDTDDHNPLIRALAIRTMGCLRVEKIIDYLLEPLKKALADQDPYVRKTAALCVAKLFDLSPATTIENGLIAILQEMLADRNPMVIANAVAALAEINQTSVHRDVFVLNGVILMKLLAALNECTEWGQVCIMDSIASYHPADLKEANEIIERVVPRLQHVNPSVILSAIRVLMIYAPFLAPDDAEKIWRKASPPLVTLLSCDPEIQYISLRNISLILQKQPAILSQELRVFFIKYTDPSYVKLEKLKIMVKLCQPENVDQVLSELKEYCTEVDMEFVKQSINAIGQVGIKYDAACSKCVEVLMDLLKGQVSYVVHQCIIVMKDIFRKYPGMYLETIPTLTSNVESLTEPDAKASLVWIIGEYASVIANADELLEFFVQTFGDESSTVQNQILSAVVKLFLKKGASPLIQSMVKSVLEYSTQVCENPDIRDRAFVYWRLLSIHPQSANAVALAPKPRIVSNENFVPDSILDELITEISSLASVYHKLPRLFIHEDNFKIYQLIGENGDEDVGGGAGAFGEGYTGSSPVLFGDPPRPPTSTAAPNIEVGNLLDLDFGNPVVSLTTAATSLGMDNLGMALPSLVPSSSATRPAPPLVQQVDLLSMDDMFAPASVPSFFGNPDIAAPPASTLSMPKSIFLSTDACDGLEVSGVVYTRDGGATFVMDMTLTNRSPNPMSDFAIQFNLNTLGLVPASTLEVPSLAPFGGATDISLPLVRYEGHKQPSQPPNALQVALKNDRGIYYFETMIVADEHLFATLS